MLRLCTVCNKKVKYGTKCECEVNKQKKRHEEYKKYRTDVKEQRFYNSKAWINCRELARVKTLGLDIFEYYVNKRIVNAETYHHIIELKDDFSKRLDVNNLIGLTNANHQLIHRLYERDKANTQRKLRELLDRFNEEFN